MSKAREWFALARRTGDKQITIGFTSQKELDEYYDNVYFANTEAREKIHVREVLPEPQRVNIELIQAITDLKLKVLEHKRAYSVELFPNSEKLDDSSTTASISARMGRHMCDCFLRYIDEALAKIKEAGGK